MILFTKNFKCAIVKENNEIIEKMKEISLEVINSNISDNYVEFNKIKNDPSNSPRLERI